MAQRRPAHPLIHAVRTAGPTRLRLVVGAVVGIVIVVALAATVQRWGAPVAILVFAAVFAGVGLLDRDAWMARSAIYQYGALQSERIGSTFPTDSTATDDWLADPENAGDPVERGYVLFNAGRPDDALASLDQARQLSPTEAASAERLRLTIARSSGNEIDPARLEELVAALPADQQRWQRLSLAVMELNADVADGQPWRDRFVAAVGNLGPWRLQRRAWFVIVTQQFAMAITFGFVFIVLSLATRS